MKSSIHLPLTIHQAAIYFHSRSGGPLYSNVPLGEERIELVIGGRGWVLDDGKHVEVGPGQLVWHIPGDETICRSDPADPYSCLNIRFRTKRKWPPRRQAHLSHWESVESARRFAEQVVHWYVDETVDREGLIQWIYGTLLIQSRRRVGQAERSNLSTRTKQVLAELEGDPVERKSLTEIAQRVGWSVSHLHAVFKKEIGATPNEIVQARRLRGAKERLATTELSIKEVAAECGYSNSAAFCHSFRQRTGESPKAWRLRHRSVGR